MEMWKKIAIRVFSVIGIVMALFVLSIIYFLGGRCGSEPYKSVVSPNGKYKAVIYQFDCGATTGFSTQISILGANEDLEESGGNVFSSDGHPNDAAPEVRWVSDHQLNIHQRAGFRVYKQEVSSGWLWNKIDITYN
ncbi:hypothetical protein EOE67_14280 [Rheinheimera riviphila]|uniref:Uncharacterized protein n=1 Tax=Rheinheimera riviphila TaxID=1834037 RepID=A0A437QLF1_9GAMM|nr:DUF5412 family protein [Rheinheimera riviphila]RVU35341.1 hypothetical protein EOE67_14280 [Rheinheimera riviphila]